MPDQSVPSSSTNAPNLVRIVVQIEKDANPKEIRDDLTRMGINPVWADENTESPWKSRVARGGKWFASRVRPESFDELIYSAEVPRDLIPDLIEKPWIARLDESPNRVLREEPDVAEVKLEGDEEAQESNWPLRPDNASYRGKGATLVIIDSGIDIFHRALQNEDGTTRLYAIYDQRGNREGKTIRSKGTKEFGIKGLYLSADINKMIKAGREKNNHLPFRQQSGHGTMVTSIAAGSEYDAPTGSSSRESGRKFCGVAPESNIIFICCHHGEYETGSVPSLGYSMSHVMVLRTLARLAPRRGDDLRAMVVNMSFGEHLGAHDGSTLLEAQIGEFTGDGRKPGICVVKSAGNSGASGGSTSVNIPPLSYADIPLTIDARESLPNEIGFNTELWFASCFAFKVTVFDPGGDEITSLDVQAGGTRWASEFSKNGNKVVIGAMRYHNDNGDTSVLVRIHRGINNYHAGTWTIRLERLDKGAQPAHIDAWLDLLDSRAPSFANATPDRTLTIPGTAEQIITVGAVKNPADPMSVMACSSRGPGRNGATKPELTAPGNRIIGARALSESALRTGFGTSFAAPQVSGAIALLYARKIADGKPLPNATQIRAALINSSRGFTGMHDNGAGFGTLDIDRFLEEF